MWESMYVREYVYMRERERESVCVHVMESVCGVNDWANKYNKSGDTRSC